MLKMGQQEEISIEIMTRFDGSDGSPGPDKEGHQFWPRLPFRGANKNFNEAGPR